MQDGPAIARFVAVEASTVKEEHLVVAGIAGVEPSQYLMFQRSLPISDVDDWGVHIEYCDQINSGYEKIRRCSLCRGLLGVELVEPIDHEKLYTGFEIELRLSDVDWNALADGLRDVFTDREELLFIDDSPGNTLGS